VNAKPLSLDATHIEPAPNAGGRHRDRDWWAKLTSEDLQDEVRAMTTRENEALISELNAAIASTGGVVTDQGADPDWRERARRALTHQRRARAIVAAELKSRLDEAAVEMRANRERIVARAKDLVAENNLPGALMLVLEWIEGFGKKHGAPGSHSSGNPAGGSK